MHAILLIKSGYLVSINHTKLPSKKSNDPIHNWEKEMNIYFPQRRHMITNKHFKKYSLLPIIREIRLKIIMKYLLQYINSLK